MAHLASILEQNILSNVMPDTIRYGFIHSTLCPLFTLSIRVLHSNAGHIQKKSLVMSLFSLALGHIDKKFHVSLC